MDGVAWHRAQRARPSLSGGTSDVETLADWRAFASAFLRLKAQRDHLARRVVDLEAAHELDTIKLEALQSRIASLAEDNGDGGW
jgi:hypothetical protein